MRQRNLHLIGLIGLREHLQKSHHPTSCHSRNPSTPSMIQGQFLNLGLMMIRHQTSYLINQRHLDLPTDLLGSNTEDSSSTKSIPFHSCPPTSRGETILHESSYQSLDQFVSYRYLTYRHRSLYCRSHTPLSATP